MEEQEKRGRVSEQRINTENRKWREGQKEAATWGEPELIVKTARCLDSE